MWHDAKPYQMGDLFLGQLNGQKVGIGTERHAITIASAGAGKGAAVIIPNLLKWPHNALVIDPKGEAAEATAKARANKGQAVHVVDPFESTTGLDFYLASYNPLDEIDPDALTVREDIETISDGIVMRADASAAHWDDGAQSLISGLIGYVLETKDESEKNLITVRRVLMDNTEGGAFEKAIDYMAHATSFGGVMQEGASAAMAKEGDYFVSNARKNTRWLDSRAMVNALASSSFSLADLKAGKATVYLVLPANYLGQHGRFLRLFVRCGIEAMARKLPTGELRGQQCLFLLDEFFSLGYIDEIAKAAGLMRGYGLQLWPILQDLGQLVTLYGREGSETFFANADLHQFFGNLDGTTLQHIQDGIGVKTHEDTQVYVDLAIEKSNKLQPSFLDSADIKVMKHQKAREMMEDGAAWSAREQGKQRIELDGIARLIQKRGDVVADHMICFTYGRTRLLIQPAPHFRPIQPPRASQTSMTQKAAFSLGKMLRKALRSR